ncbi:MAG TPA: phenylalanine--tRNA ligase subunit beta, partial [Elusimicrobiales bacterium]|nr:phenylalanine--tRNA ligase subunit beta [Elusimicrobiales bacterium]
MAVGQKIPFARVGASLSGMVLKKARIRGVESEGMICSAGELGLKGLDNSGILVLPEESPLGADAAGLFEKPDHILEVEVTPNLAYCLSHYALARELCAFYGLPLKPPSVPEFAAAGTAVPIKIASPDLCRRYTGIVVENILPAGQGRPAATPDWMAARLRAMGANPKNNVLIDVSNYVMYELGQPAHCFDRARLSGPEIIVRPAREGETLRSLDGQDLKLDGTMLVIADRDRPAALAGVIGGLETAVSDATSSVLIESASFSPSAIRSASRKAGVKTESSYRFERGTDPELTMLAARRLAQLILAAAPGAKVTQVTDNYPSRYAPKVIEASAERINAILGTEIAGKDIFACLKAIQPDLKEGTPWRFPVPSYRQDMESVWDLAEEAARHIGYEVIPSRSGMRVMRSSVTASFSVSAELKERLACLGFSEIYNYDLVSRRDLRACMLPEEEAVPLKNPLSSDHELLRTSLAPGVLKTLRYNLNRGAGSVSVFEVGNVYRMAAGGHREETMCAGLMYGAFPASGFWRGGSSQADLYILKGAVVRALEGFGHVRFEKPKAPPSYLHHSGCLEIKLGGSHAGWLGMLSPEAAANSDLKDGRIYYFELPLKPLAEAYKPEFRERVRRVRPVTAFPGVWRDLSVVI